MSTEKKVTFICSEIQPFSNIGYTDLTLIDNDEEFYTNLYVSDQEAQKLYNSVSSTRRIDANIIHDASVIFEVYSGEYILILNLKNILASFELRIHFKSKQPLIEFCKKYNIPSFWSISGYNF